MVPAAVLRNINHVVGIGVGLGSVMVNGGQEFKIGAVQLVVRVPTRLGHVVVPLIGGMGGGVCPIHQ